MGCIYDEVIGVTRFSSFADDRNSTLGTIDPKQETDPYDVPKTFSDYTMLAYGLHFG
jgi:hypothetical protein